MLSIDIPPVIAGPCNVHAKLCLVHDIPARLDELAREIRGPFRYEIEYAGEQPRLGILKPGDSPTEPRFLIHTLSPPVTMPPGPQLARPGQAELRGVGPLEHPGPAPPVDRNGERSA